MNHSDLELVTSELDDDPARVAYRIVATGEIDLATAPQLADALTTLIGQGATLVVLDAADIKFIDSSGLRVLVTCGNAMTDAGGRLLIEGMSGAVQRVLEISGLLEQYRA